MTDLVMAALSAEHFASPRGYQPPADVVKAKAAISDLIDRTKDGPRSRDEKRLLARYRRTIEEHQAALVAKHFPTAPNTKEHTS